MVMDQLFDSVSVGIESKEEKNIIFPLSLTI